MVIDLRRRTTRYAARRDDSHRDDDVDVLEVVPGRMPARADGPADPGDRGAVDGDPDARPRRGTAGRPHLEDPGRDRHERADERRGEPERHGNVLEAVEPALGALDPLRGDVGVAAVALEQRMAAVDADQPAAGRAEQCCPANPATITAR